MAMIFLAACGTPSLSWDDPPRCFFTNGLGIPHFEIDMSYCFEAFKGP
jgi:hypothetical protein